MKKAFSLIELMIVIVIIGVIYTIAIGNFKNIRDKDELLLSLKNLKPYLQNIKHDKSVELICTDECQSCNIFVDGSRYTKKDIENFLDKSIRVYRYDFNLGMVEKEYPNGICFSFMIDKKGISQQLFVEYKGVVYDYTEYLKQTPVYGSIQEAADAKENLIREVLK